MEFPKEFFLDEVREGFYIPAMMKRAWAAELEILATSLLLGLWDSFGCYSSQGLYSLG